MFLMRPANLVTQRQCLRIRGSVRHCFDYMNTDCAVLLTERIFYVNAFLENLLDIFWTEDSVTFVSGIAIYAVVQQQDCSPYMARLEASGVNKG